MKNRICPKCEGNEIYTSDGATILKEKVHIDNWTEGAFIDTYMCMNCGYLEYYVTRPMDRERVAKRWRMVN